MTNLKVHFSKNTDDWKTPKFIYDDFINRGFIDPCPFQSIENNLNKDFGNVKLFINPPYSDIISWINFAIFHHQKYKNRITLLVPARTDTKWFHKALEYGFKVTFIKGRLKFNDGPNSAPFPSIYLWL